MWVGLGDVAQGTIGCCERSEVAVEARPVRVTPLRVEQKMTQQSLLPTGWDLNQKLHLSRRAETSDLRQAAECLQQNRLLERGSHC